MRVVIHNEAPRTNTLNCAPVRARHKAPLIRVERDRETWFLMGMQHAEHIPTLLMNEVAFVAWVDQAMAGDILEYFRGFLALDIEKTCSRLCEQDRLELAKLASRAMLASDYGRVHLMQRRNAVNDFSYLAVVRPRSPRAASLLSMALEEAA